MLFEVVFSGFLNGSGLLGRQVAGWKGGGLRCAGFLMTERAQAEEAGWVGSRGGNSVFQTKTAGAGDRMEFKDAGGRACGGLKSIHVHGKNAGQCMGACVRGGGDGRAMAPVHGYAATLQDACKSGHTLEGLSSQG